MCFSIILKKYDNYRYSYGTDTKKLIGDPVTDHLIHLQFILKKLD